MDTFVHHDGRSEPPTPDLDRQRNARKTTKVATALSLSTALALAWLAHGANNIAWVSPKVATPWGKPDFLSALKANPDGQRLELLELRQPSGARIAISYLAGHFTPDKIISAAGDWTALHLTNAMMVSSVNEAQSVQAGLNSGTSPFCQFADPPRSIAAGDVDVHQCTSARAKAYGITHVANLAVVTYDNIHLASSPCYSPDSTEEAGRLCVKKRLEDGYKTLFAEVAKTAKKSPIDFLIVPAVGHGFGQLDFQTAYGSFFAKLVERFGSAAPLPRDIVITNDSTVSDRGQAEASQLATDLAVALNGLQQQWEAKGVEVRAANLALLWIASGSCAGVGAMLLLRLFRRGLTPLPASTKELACLTVGWIAAGFGTATGAQKLLESMSLSAPWTAQSAGSFVLGAVGVVLSAYFLSASEAYKGMVKQSMVIQSPQAPVSGEATSAKRPLD
jgi:hypothetical protein